MKNMKKNYVIARNAKELGAILGLSSSDTALMKYKADFDLTCDQEN